MIGGAGMSKSSMTSKVSIERFVYNLGVLDGIIGREDVPFDESAKDFNPFLYWRGIVKYLKDVGFFKAPRREAHL
jgi:hypothetical protein